MKKCFLIVALLSCISSPLYAEGKNKFELADGSVIEGNIASFENGVYTLDSASLGRITIDNSKIQKITALGNAPKAEAVLPPADINAQYDNVQMSIASNPDMMNMVAGLLSDPQINEILSDEEIMAQVNSKDIKSLSSNKKFMKLLNNPKVEEIERQIQSQ